MGLLEDWDIIQEQLPDSLSTATLANYRNNFFILNKFSGEEDDHADVVDSGLPLNVERKWDIIMGTNDLPFNHHTFVVCTRALMITPEGVMVQ